MEVFLSNISLRLACPDKPLTFNEHIFRNYNGERQLFALNPSTVQISKPSKDVTSNENNADGTHDKRKKRIKHIGAISTNEHYSTLQTRHKQYSTSINNLLH